MFDRSWVAEKVLRELTTASLAVETDDEAVLIDAHDGPAGHVAVPRRAGGHHGSPSIATGEY